MANIKTWCCIVMFTLFVNITKNKLKKNEKTAVHFCYAVLDRWLPNGQRTNYKRALEGLSGGFENNTYYWYYRWNLE